MHEAKFTEEIVTAIISQVEGAQKKPKRVKVRVGEMFHLEKESVLMYYALLTRGTRLEGIEIELEEDPVIVRCKDCRQAGGVEDHHLLMCTYCDSQNVEVLTGDEIVTELLSEEDKK